MRDDEIRQAIARSSPVSRKSPKSIGRKQEFQIGGRSFHEPLFSNPDGRARCTSTTCRMSATRPAVDSADDRLAARANSTRSSTRMKTTTGAGPPRRDRSTRTTSCVSRSRDGDRVKVHGPAGAMHGIRATAFEPLKTGKCREISPRGQRSIEKMRGRSAEPDAGVQECLDSAGNLGIRAAASPSLRSRGQRSPHKPGFGRNLPPPAFMIPAVVNSCIPRTKA